MTVTLLIIGVSQLIFSATNKSSKTTRRLSLSTQDIGHLYIMSNKNNIGQSGPLAL